MLRKPVSILCLGFFMVIMDVTVINIVLPLIREDFHCSMSNLQWVVDAYTLSFACFLVTSGRLADRFEAKYVFLFGLISFSVSSLSCGLATSISQLIIYRCLQGVAASLVVPTSLALISSLFYDNKKRAKAVGLWGSVGGMAAICGPILGAFLGSWLGWRSVFFINIPIGVAAAVFTYYYVSKRGRKKTYSFDVVGQFFCVFSALCLSYSLIKVGELGIFSSTVLVAILAFFVVFTLFVLVERYVKHPMLPLNIFARIDFSVAIFVGLALNVGFYGTLFILPIFFHQFRHYSTMVSGMAVLPLLGFAVFASYLSGRLCARIGAKVPAVSGLLLGAIGFVGLLALQSGSPTYLYLAFFLSMVSFGMAFSMPASTLILMNVVRADDVGLASGIFNMSRQLGSLIGVALFGSILSLSSNFIKGMHITFIISATLFAFAGLMVCCIPKLHQPLPAEAGSG